MLLAVMPEPIDPSVLGALTLGSGLGLVLAGLAVKAKLLETRVRSESLRRVRTTRRVLPRMPMSQKAMSEADASAPPFRRITFTALDYVAQTSSIRGHDGQAVAGSRRNAGWFDD